MMRNRELRAEHIFRLAQPRQAKLDARASSRYKMSAPCTAVVDDYLGMASGSPVAYALHLRDVQSHGVSNPILILKS